MVYDMVNTMVKGTVNDMVGRHGKHKPPSRLRYEQTHPTITIRVDINTYERIKAIQEKTAKSLASIIKESLGLQEHSTAEAYEKGYRDAQKEHTFSFFCSVCKGEITISNKDEAVEAVREKLKTLGHTNCVRDHKWHQNMSF